MSVIIITPYKQTTSQIPTGNYAVFSSADAGPGVTISENGLRYFSNGGNGARGSVGKSSGKWYWEVELISSSPSYGGAIVGIASKSVPLIYFWESSTTNYTAWWAVGGSPQTGYIIQPGGVRQPYGFALAGDVMGIMMDLDNRTLTFAKNGVTQGAISIPSDTYYPFLSDPSSGSPVDARMNFGTNFGSTPLRYPVPEGYHAGLYIE